MDCIFCKIINKEIPDSIVMEGENWVAVDDINPAAPVHVLVIPKKHVEYLEDAKNDRDLLGELMLAVDKVAHEKGVAEKGYRVIINQKEEGGQVVPHLHIHVLGGKKLPSGVIN